MRVRRLPVCDDLAQWASTTPGAEFRELLPAADIHRRPPNTVEAEVHPSYATRLVRAHPRSYVARVRNARLVGRYGLVVLPDGSYPGEMAYERRLLEIDPDYRKPPPRRLVRKSGPYVSLMEKWSAGRNYYHWIHDALGLLAGVLDDVPPETRFVVSRDLLEYQYETLALLGIQDRLAIYDDEEIWEVDELFVTPPCVKSGTDRPEVAVWLRERLSATLNLRSVPHRRIYFSRDGASVRRTVNEEEVEALLGERGFEKCIAAPLSVADTIKLLSESVAVVGTHGASLTNILFAPPGLKVVDMVPDHLTKNAYVYWSLADVLDHDYWYFLVQSVPRGDDVEPDVHVPLDKLAATLDRLL